MRTKLVEVTDQACFNFGKFMVAEFDQVEWGRRSIIEAENGFDISLLGRCGWDRNGHIMVFDIQTGEGALFKPGGSPKHDLEKHRVWVCLLFEPFLKWLYKWVEEQRKAMDGIIYIDTIPDKLVLPNRNPGLSGYRRAGCEEAKLQDEIAKLRRENEDLKRWKADTLVDPEAEVTYGGRNEATHCPAAGCRHVWRMHNMANWCELCNCSWTG